MGLPDRGATDQDSRLWGHWQRGNDVPLSHEEGRGLRNGLWVFICVIYIVVKI